MSATETIKSSSIEACAAYVCRVDVSATFTDPAGHHVTSWIVSWGDGTIQTYGGSDSSADGSDSDPTSTDTKAFTHTYPNSPNYSYQISITAVTDENVYESGTSITTSSATSWSSDTMTVGTTSSNASLYATR